MKNLEQPSATESRSQHTPDLQHNADCDAIDECQSNHSSARSTVKHSPTSTGSHEEESQPNASHAEPKKSKSSGLSSKGESSQHMEASAVVAENPSPGFLQSTTLAATGEDNETLVSGDTSFTNGLRNTTSRSRVIACSASTATARGDNSENVRTRRSAGKWHVFGRGERDGYYGISVDGKKIGRIKGLANARLIAAAPRMYAFISTLASNVGQPEAEAILREIHGSR
jgi:hypothetical protein